MDIIRSDQAIAVARILLKIEAVSLNVANPFRYSSGFLSPIYCDNRLILSFPEVRQEIIAAFLQLIDAGAWSCDVVAGTATAGIPHAAWIADRLNKPMVYVRGAPKAHGQGKLIEGVVEAGQRVLVVEDLISTGGSALHAVAALREQGCEVNHVAAIFDYQLPNTDARFGEAGVQLGTLSCLSVLLQAAIEQAYISEAEATQITAWGKDPAAWSKRMQET